MVVKYVGRDCELSTTGLGGTDRAMASWQVVRGVLEQIGPVFRGHGGEVWSRDLSRMGNCYASSASIDCLRNWASNGQCYYSDMGHVEVCTAPTADPRRFAAQCISTLMAVEEARRLAQAESEEEVRFSLSAANADVLDPAISWGTHLNVSVSNALWEDLCLDHNHPAILGFVTSALAAAAPFFGAGYLLPMKDGSTIYSLSGRAHHLSRIKTLSTTEAFRRGLLNTRREPHAEGQDRLHLIGLDYSIVSAAMLCTFVQCILAAAEEGYCGMIVYDPVRALRTWSWGLDTATGRMHGKAAMVDGRKLGLAETLLAMCRRGLIGSATAPGAAEMLSKIVELSRYLQQGSIDRCARHLDWAAKLMCLLSGGQTWGSAAARLADHDFANTDPERGMLWRLWNENLVDPLVTEDDVQRCLVEAPTETRAWARGQIIRKFAGQISSVDWDHVELYRSRDRWWPRLRVEMPRLDSLDRQTFGPIIERARDVAQLGELLEQNTRGAAQESDPVMDVADQLAVPADET
jgi:hypothetical protein